MAWTVDEQLALTACEAVAAIQAGKLRATDYAATLLARAAALASLNALTALNMEGALKAARRIDALSPDAKARLPLAGLPVVVKDNINTADLQTAGATPALAGFKPKSNAPSVQRLIDAGAVLLGKANMHELACGITSTNFAAPGPVRNPYDPGLIPGGSSGGNAVAVAARIAPAGLGTDTSGSNRIPAALTGCVGFRPSVGNGGAQRRYHDPDAVIPLSHTRDTVGPITRTVADAALLDAVITGDSTLPPVALAGLRIGLPVPLWSDLDPAVEAVARAAQRALGAAGVTFVELALPDLLALNEQTAPITAHETLDDIRAWLTANHAPVQTVEELAQSIASPDVREIFAAILADPFGPYYQAALTTWRPRLQQLYATTFTAQRIDALLFPTTCIPATPLDEIRGSSVVSVNGRVLDTMLAYLRNTDPSANAGLPGLSVPAGRTADGLPVGIEFDGPLGSDRRLLAIGSACEQVLGALAPPTI
ncbi:indoleacetamide hydrolase [Paraburkholderia rhizosphaerae]|uniref:Mandelamide amidase n=1 Tax=Paraburkholderia rhizosphaerae TaxID=480658 RepID=A0A4R8M353_9BURK|nr:indoleacetamide hydrolase [Paraburkholderia rhizosphaerae]TDY54153.1 mandelamide amidase [Paraburkholderia rhizosphaerae]